MVSLACCSSIFRSMAGEMTIKTIEERKLNIRVYSLFNITNMKPLILAILFPLIIHSQSNKYYFLQTEVDARNALFGGTVNDTGYNWVFKAGLSKKWLRADVFYETFAELHYNSGGVNLNGLLNYNKKFKQGAGIQMSLIDKPNKLTSSLSLNGLLEYHFGKLFASTRAEVKMRTDWNITVFSGFVGVGYKI